MKKTNIKIEIRKLSHMECLITNNRPIPRMMLPVH